MMTSLMLAAAVAVPCIAGISLVCLVCPKLKLGALEIVFVASLGIPVGFGLVSLLLFLWLTETNGQTAGAKFLLVSVSMLLAGAALARQARRGAALDRSSEPQHDLRWLAAALACGLVMTVVVVVLTEIASPHGGWDNWYIWNRHAIFMEKGGIHWRDAFSAPEAGWAADYPLLTPGAIASAWIIFGRESLLVSNVIGLLFTIAPVGLLVSALSFLRSRTQGLLAGVLLAFSPQLAAQGASQLADVPLATFYVAAVALLAMHDLRGGDRRWLVMSGIVAGMAAWTKNEGLLFVLVLSVARTTAVAFSIGWQDAIRQGLRFAAGLVPVLLVVLYFKLRIVQAPNDLVMGQSAGTEVQRLLSFGRYWMISKTFLFDILDIGGWVVTLPALLLMYLLLAGVNTRHRWRLPILTGALTLVAMIAGHFFVYVLTPHDLAWHLRTSLSRVLMQLWPTALLTFALVARTIEEQDLAASEMASLPATADWNLGDVRRRPAAL